MTIAQTIPTPIPDNVRLSGEPVVNSPADQRSGTVEPSQSEIRTQAPAVNESKAHAEIFQECVVSGSAKSQKQPRAPRSSAEIVEKYRRNQGLTNGQIWPLKMRPQSGSAYRIWLLVDHHLRGQEMRVDRYLADAAWRWITARCKATTSQETYLRIFAHWLAWQPRGGSHARSLEMQAQTIAPRLNDYLRSREDEDGDAERTICTARAVLRSWFGYLVELDLMARQPINRETRKAWRIRRERVVRGDGTRQALTATQAQALVDWAKNSPNTLTGLAVLLQVAGGLRGCEVVRADRKHLTFADDGTAQLAVQGKGDRQRVVALEPVIVVAWHRHIDTNRLHGQRGPLLNHHGRRFHVRSIQSWSKQGLTAIGRPDLSGHDLRRTYATVLHDKGADIHQVQHVLGHSSIELTKDCYVTRQKPLSVTTGFT